jgi:exopolyphosphatase/guanosine-5'-triphosphate,3'-diphosphate pyrophosphatase
MIDISSQDISDYGHDPAIKPVMDMIEQYDPDHPHTYTVAALSVRLFDDLSMLHHFGPAERRLLFFAALLHDIGWSVLSVPHHKGSMNLILADTTIPLTSSERSQVALIARYHRKSHPSCKHSHFSALSPALQDTVRWNAAILRVADSLDRLHSSCIQEIHADILSAEIRIRCNAPGCLYGGTIEDVFRKKSELLREITGRNIEITWN